MSSWDALSNAAAVFQLVGVDAGGLIARIRQAAQTAHQNKKDCEILARRVDALAELLPYLQEREREREPVAMRSLARLEEVLSEALELVMSCQGKGRTYRFLKGSGLADRFRHVERMIDVYVSVFPMVSHIAIASRLDSSASSRSSGSRADGEEEQEFTLAEITAATGNYAVVLSDGDAATVYKGRLHDGREVAVKRLNPGRPGAAEDAFFTEVAILRPIRHDNIVRLVGSCAAADGQRFVVTHPCITNGSFYDHLHSHHRSSSPVTASWKARIQVLLGTARAIKHLHCDAKPLVIHANITSSNILLEATTTTTSAGPGWPAPRLSDFGASVWRAAGVESQAVEVAAAAGYADPEYCHTGHLKPASDVYGLGVVMLETLTGQPPVVTVWDDGSGSMAPMTLASFATQSVLDGRLLDVLDRRPVSNPTTWQLEPLQLVANTAAQCLCFHGDNRPPIAHVVANLEQAFHLICARGHF